MDILHIKDLIPDPLEVIQVFAFNGSLAINFIGHWIKA